jgi:hypothetical protein
MLNFKKGIIFIFIIIAELIFFPITILSAIWLKLIRKYVITFWFNKGFTSRRIFEYIGVFPIIKHYYEPQFNYNQSKKKLRYNLDGINLNIENQLNLLSNFNFNNELLSLLSNDNNDNSLHFSFKTQTFLSGDAEFLYNMVRHLKPSNIIEIGCGSSTLMMQHAINYNRECDNLYSCNHICIEPFENQWLEKLPVQVIRKKLEDIETSFFNILTSNDILFIDSSHIIRPGGDVLYEYLQLLPSLNKDVYIHIHDIFTPNDYLNDWHENGLLFWNEQYLLEALLMHNSNFEIVAALNFLKHNYYQEFKQIAPFLTPDREPGSFWLKKT